MAIRPARLPGLDFTSSVILGPCTAVILTLAYYCNFLHSLLRPKKMSLRLGSEEQECNEIRKGASTWRPQQIDAMQADDTGQDVSHREAGLLQILA
jgi:hypothetical protein